jgi:hypothetical protein
MVLALKAYQGFPAWLMGKKVLTLVCRRLLILLPLLHKAWTQIL